MCLVQNAFSREKIKTLISCVFKRLNAERGDSLTVTKPQSEANGLGFGIGFGPFFLSLIQVWQVRIINPQSARSFSC
jgi:hypothetical protein